jgi:CSLREA domain-containing protein
MRVNRVLPSVALSMTLAASAAAFAAAPAGAAATFQVNSIYNGADLNPGDGSCDANPAPNDQCTLRAAIQEANALAGADTITFKVPGRAVVKINVPNALPQVSEALTINGYSAANTKVNTKGMGSNAKLRIFLKGGAGFHGLRLAAPTIVKGLVISGFDKGVFIVPGGEGSRLQGNFIGTTPNGMGKLKNHDHGVHVDCDAAVTIGGASKQARNIIAGNEGSGILLCERVAGTIIKGNLIGVGANGSKNLGNGQAGVHAFGTQRLVIGGDAKLAQNAIAHNRDGIRVDTGAKGIAVLGNSFFRNIGPAIDLGPDGVTPNDGAGDADGGANNLQNFPLIDKAKRTATKTQVNGRMLGETTSTYRVRLFVDTYKEREGKRFLKAITVKTNGQGKASWKTNVAKLSLGTRITATATNVTRNPDESSEFSVSKPVR